MLSILLFLAGTDDYSLNMIEVVFRPEDNRMCFTVSVSEDDLVESIEVFQIQLVTQTESSTPLLMLNPITTLIQIMDTTG